MDSQANKKHKCMDAEDRFVVARGGMGGVRNMSEIDKVQVYIYKMSKSWGCNVQHGDYS